MRKALAIVGLAAVVSTAAALSGIGLPEEARGQEAGRRTVTVRGTGFVEARPDKAAFSFGVETRAEGAEAASDGNAVGMRRLIAALRAAGVDDDDIQTQHVSVWPAGRPDSGYIASNSVQVSTSVERAGELVEVATSAGANTLSGPSLQLDDSHELEEQALERALEDARRKGGVLAAAADADLGAVVAVVEGGGAEPFPEHFIAASRAAEDGAAPIEPGKLRSTAVLTVTFALQ